MTNYLLSSCCHPSHLEPMRSNHYKLNAATLKPMYVGLLESGLAESSLTKQAKPQEQEKRIVNLPEQEIAESTLSIVVVGAKEALAREKIFPTLHALFSENQLPKGFPVCGYARSTMSNYDLQNPSLQNRQEVSGEAFFRFAQQAE
ncbi:hypothetical protein QQ045_010645 [Rhodiola kirilowii]